MKALITGASSGIGRDMAIILDEMGFDLILAARRQDRLEALKEQLSGNVQIITTDLSREESCFALYEQVKEQEINILINNAGFGLFGRFDRTDLRRELEMINLNIKAVHILTKLFLRDFKRRNAGYILNVASSAAFLPGPLLSSYYATKAYVLRLTQAVYEELRRDRSRVYIGALCPGPVDTEFSSTANVRFSLKGMGSRDVALCAIDGMFQRKLVIVPGLKMKLARIGGHFLPDKLLLRAAYHFQKKKEG
ncbi:SDR family NAD(P)-dependent oxidoreductase [Marasmitruncus massiliensis]|uniref:SDR family NAD(P)-dependent oxidoreductase n=1 Tax=Marasmitruncus massiliensis TaxID=1944642 RepID=UPI000C7B8474|nr:SDR family oxidoreductase [Marasmitruncus massiliensis]